MKNDLFLFQAGRTAASSDNPDDPGVPWTFPSSRRRWVDVSGVGCSIATKRDGFFGKFGSCDARVSFLIKSVDPSAFSLAHKLNFVPVLWLVSSAGL